MAAYYLAVGGVAHRFVVGNTVSRHVYAHIGRRLIGGLTVNFFENIVKHGENFHVAIVVDGGFPVSLEVKRVNHVDVVKVRRCRLVSDVYGVLKRQIPDGKSLEFGIAGFDSALVVVIKLT